MQQKDSTFKYVQFWNNQALDTHHDIIISVDYALYNYNDTPSCGFCIGLFESITDKPRGGGPAYSLAYTPNDIKVDCNIENNGGLEAAIYGIGFDPSGIFAKRTPYVSGVDYTVSNSICLRDGIKNDYKFLKQTENLQNFNISQQLISQNEKIEYKQARIIFSKCMSQLRVQVKNDDDKEFTQVLETEFPILPKKSIKIGLFYTSIDQHSRFLLKQFNVAGFPAREETNYDTPCFQDIETNYDNQSKRLAANKNWIASNRTNGFDIYKFDGKQFSLKQEIRSTKDIKILNYSDNLLFAKSNNSLIVYEFRGNKMVKQNTITIPTTADITSCAGYKDTLVVASSSSGENYFVYNYIRESEELSNIGKWEYYQTFNYSLSTGFGTNIEMSENYLISYSTNNFVISFKKDPDFGYQYHQTIVPPFSSAKGFGYSMSIQRDNEMIIGAPFGEKRYITGYNQGEAFHYVLSPFTKEWVLISDICQYFDTNTLSGAFGYSVKIKGNYAAVGCPFEPAFLDDYPLIEVPTQGKVYLFKKDDQGHFTNRTIYYPPTILGDEIRNYGKQVNIFGDNLAVSMPFLDSDQNDVIDIYNLTCPALSEPLLRPTPTSTPPNTPTPTQTNTPTNTRTPAITPTNTQTPTNTRTPAVTPTPTASMGATPNPTPTPTRTPAVTPTPTNTRTPTPTPTQFGLITFVDNDPMVRFGNGDGLFEFI